MIFTFGIGAKNVFNEAKSMPPICLQLHAAILLYYNTKERDKKVSHHNLNIIIPVNAVCRILSNYVDCNVYNK